MARILFYSLFQYSRARENEPPALLTRPPVPTSHLSSLQQKVEVNQRKSTNIANTRNQRTNAPKRKEGSRRRRMCCPPHRGLFNLCSKAHLCYSNGFFSIAHCSFVLSQKLSKPWEKRDPGGREGAERKKREACGPARGDPTCARESLPSATGRTDSRRENRDVSKTTSHNILAGIVDWFQFWSFQSWESRSFSFCWPKASSLQVWPEDSRQRNDGISQPIPLLSAFLCLCSNYSL